MEDRIAVRDVCTAFTAIGNDLEGMDEIGRICAFLDPPEGAFTAEDAYRDAPGDGQMSVPQYEEIRGEKSISQHRFLREDGTLLSGTYSDPKRAGRVKPEAARAFIAAAFGTEELSRYDPMEVETTQTLSRLIAGCRTDRSECAASEALQEARTAWITRQEVRALDATYRTFAERLSDRSAILEQTERWRDRVTWTQPEPLIEKKQRLEWMVEIAREEWMIEQTSILNERTDWFLQSFIATEKRRRFTSGFWFDRTRFSDALTKGLAAMPEGQTTQERYCVALNSKKMAKKLYTMINSYPQSERYIKPREHEVRDWRGALHIVRYAGHYSPHGHDYTPEYLERSAMVFTNKTCTLEFPMGYYRPLDWPER